MKKILILFLAMGFIVNSGCLNQSNNPLDKPDNSAFLNQTTISEIKNADNPYFFKSKNSKAIYSGKFNLILNTKGSIDKEVTVHINRLADLKSGELYELQIDPIENLDSERLILGYFYVQERKIYKVNALEVNLNKFKTSGDIPEDSTVVCQDNEILDALGKDEKGVHHYLVVNGNRREYHEYSNLVETGYYENLFWEKGKGLIYYKSGFGAMRDQIELKLKD